MHHVPGRALSFVVLATLVGCGAPEAVFADARLVDRSQQALSTGQFLFANGTYGAGCAGRSGNWSLALDGFNGTPTNTVLSVVKDDGDCVLTLTSLVTGTASDALTWVANTASPALALDASYAVSASSFASGAFYANAMQSSTSYASNFTVTILYSDNPDLAESGSDTATFITRSASASSSQIEAPDYTIDATGLTIQTDADDVVEAMGGTAQLELPEGAGAGESFKILSSDPGLTYASIDAAWLAGGSATLLSSLTSLQIPGSSFDMTDVDITTSQDRFVVIAHTVDGVRAYQVITVTFHKAS